MPEGDAMTAGAQGPVVLVVDDNFPYRSLAIAMLQARGISAEGAEDADQALKRLQEQPYALVLLDINMPGMSGNDLCRMMRRQLGMTTVPIIAYTADGLGTTPEAALAAGFDGVLLKPLVAARLDQLLATHGILAETTALA